jgi:uncharacterized protein YoxC
MKVNYIIQSMSDIPHSMSEITHSVRNITNLAKYVICICTQNYTNL